MCIQCRTRSHTCIPLSQLDTTYVAGILSYEAYFRRLQATMCPEQIPDLQEIPSNRPRVLDQ
jgi:hypothetical protein